MIRPAIILAALSAPAMAQDAPQCAGVADVLAGLQAGYGETIRARGLISAESMIVVTAGESGSWTLLVVSADGVACLMASGGMFEVVDAPEPVPNL